MALSKDAKALSSAISVTTGERVRLDNARLDADRIWQETQERVFIGSEEEIRVKRLSLLGILAKTRQKVFMVLMITMLLPRLGLEKFIQLPEHFANSFAFLGGAFFVSCLIGVIAEHRTQLAKQRRDAVEAC